MRLMRRHHVDPGLLTMLLLLRETHHRIRRAHRPPSRVHDVPIVVHDARSRCLESLMCLAVLLEEARDVRARQAGSARARVAAVHELQDLRWRLVQAVRRGRREGLAEQRLEILRPRQALLGRSRGAVRAAFRGVRAARAPSADAFAAAPSAAHLRVANVPHAARGATGSGARRRRRRRCAPARGRRA